MPVEEGRKVGCAGVEKAGGFPGEEAQHHQENCNEDIGERSREIGAQFSLITGAKPGPGIFKPRGHARSASIWLATVMKVSSSPPGDCSARLSGVPSATTRP